MARYGWTRLWILPLVLAVVLALLGGHFVRVARAQGSIDITVNGSYRFHTLRGPMGIIAQPYSNGLILYIADTGHNVIRIFTQCSLGCSGLSVFAGNGTAGYVNGAPLSSEFNKPTGIQGGFLELIYGGRHYAYHHIQIADTKNFVVRDVCEGSPPPTYPYACNTVGTATTFAGSGVQGLQNGSVTTARFGHLAGVTDTSAYIGDGDNNVIRSIAQSVVSTYAGTGVAGLLNGPRLSARFRAPTKVLSDGTGNLFVVDAGNHCIRKIDSSGNVSTFAGSGQPGHVDGAASVAQFYRPLSIVYNLTDGHYYVTDTFNNCIRRIDSNGNVTTYAGAPTAGYQDGSLLNARFNSPADLSIANGYMYVSDTNNNCIRQIDMARGVVSTFLN